MVYLAYLGESSKIQYKKGDIRFLIVRKPVGGKIPDGFNWLPQLSPSDDLFFNAQRWKNNSFTEKEKKELTNQSVDIKSEDAWWYLYEPIFNKESRKRADVKRGIKKVLKEVEKGKNVYLFCYCKDLNRCHRMLVGEYLKEIGVDVDFREEIGKEKTKQLTMF